MAQHHDAAKLGYAMYLAINIEASWWTEFLWEKVEETSKEKVPIELLVLKNNGNSRSKDSFNSKSSILYAKRRKLITRKCM